MANAAQTIPSQASATFRQHNWLLLDLGNSRLKVRVISQGTLQYSLSELHLQSPVDLLTGLMPVLSAYPVQGIAIASVLSSDDNTHIAALLQHLNAPIYFCQVGSSPLLTTTYNPNLLGIDRWLQMLALAAREADSDFVLVGCGSALTVDIVTAQQHLGGYILPSLFIQRQALLAGTRNIKVDAPVFNALTPASNTHNAVHNGIALGLVATIHYLVASHPNHRITLCGGDAPLLYQLSMANPPGSPTAKPPGNLHLVQNELVLEGLMIAISEVVG